MVVCSTVGEGRSGILGAESGLFHRVGALGGARMAGAGGKHLGTGDAAANGIRSEATPGQSARTGFAVVSDDLEFIMSQLAQVPRRKEVGWIALASVPARGRIRN